MNLNQATAPKRLDALTSMRLFLAMMVAVAHFCSRLGVPLPVHISSMAPLAVAWFFMLSGFIIAHNYSTLDTNKARCDFLILRIARLWPVHAVIITVGVFIGVSVGMSWPSWRSLLFQYTMTQSWSLNGSIAYGFNAPAWSISTEFFFYIAYVGLMIRPLWIGVLAALGTMSVGFAVPAAHGCFQSSDMSASPECGYLMYIFPPARLIEFVAGVAIYRSNIRVPQTVGLAAAAIVFLGIGLIPATDPLLNLAMWEVRLIIAGGALIASLRGDGWLARCLSVPLLVIGGEISYSIYLIHEPVHRAILPHLQGLGVLPTFTIVMLITLPASTALFYLVESPSRNAVKRLLRGAPLSQGWRLGRSREIERGAPQSSS